METKRCFNCKQEKPLDAYHVREGSRDGHFHRCKACQAAVAKLYRETHKETIADYLRKHYQKNKERIALYGQRNRANRYRYLVKHKYGLSNEEYDRLLTQQNHSCAICLAKQALVVDHNHSTGRFRALLCNRCNLGLGLLGDSAETTRRAVAYLEEHNEEKQKAA